MHRAKYNQNEQNERKHTPISSLDMGSLQRAPSNKSEKRPSKKTFFFLISTINKKMLEFIRTQLGFQKAV